MTRKSMSQQQIAAMKKRILDTALELIIQDGFQQFSMRNLASRLGITATTIYNYYSNKDEINIMIRMHGFELLYNELEKSYAKHADPLARLKSMVRSYFKFGIQYPDYYDIMFSQRTPKYLDYVKTTMEPIARIEREATLRNYTITEKTLSELGEKYGILNSDKIMLKTIHGIILIICVRDLEKRAFVVYWDGLLRISAFILFVYSGIFGDMGVPAIFIGVGDLAIGLVYCIGLPKALNTEPIAVMLGKNKC